MLKRIIDVSLSLTVIFICVPLVALILLLVFVLTGENPVIFQRRKISLDSIGFTIIKIRTLKSSKLSDESEKLSGKIFFKSGYENCVPYFCRWLRKTGLDEILQVINVLKGEMSFVGPRPLLKNDLQLIQKIEPEFYFRRTKINSKPGITGCWQVYGDRLKGTANLVELDEMYENQKSILLDFKIIIRTLFVLLTAAHSDSIITTVNREEKYNQTALEQS